MSHGIIVTLFAWIAHKLACSIRPTRKASPASCNASTAELCNFRLVFGQSLSPIFEKAPFGLGDWTPFDTSGSPSEPAFPFVFFFASEPSFDFLLSTVLVF